MVRLEVTVVAVVEAQIMPHRLLLKPRHKHRLKRKPLMTVQRMRIP
jgi:hypothetical protein